MTDTIQIPQEISAMAAMLAEEVNAQKQQKELKAKAHEKTERKDKAEKKKKEKKTEKKKMEKEKKEKKEKAPLSAFMLFNQDIRKTIKEEFPDKDFKEIGKEVGARWKSMDVEARAPYETKSKQMKEEWIKTHPDSEKKQHRKRKREQQDDEKKDTKKKKPKHGVDKEQTKQKNKKKNNNKAKTEKDDDDDGEEEEHKKPAYIRHSEMVRPEVQKAFPTMSPHSVASEVANRWRRLTQEEKEKLRA